MRSFLTWCSKYFSIPAIIIVGLLAYIFFFQDNSVARISEIDRTIDSLKQAINKEEDSLRVYRDRNKRLDNKDPELVEKVVREQHNMSLPTEEVYVFQNSEK